MINEAGEKPNRLKRMNVVIGTCGQAGHNTKTCVRRQVAASKVNLNMNFHSFLYVIPCY